MPTSTLYCSFCGKSQHEVAKLVAGPGTFICNECTSLCFEICNPAAPRASQDPFLAVWEWTDEVCRRLDEISGSLAMLGMDLREAVRVHSGRKPEQKTAEIVGFGAPAAENPTED